MAKNVFSMPASKESHQRNPFDRSFECNLNFSAGMAVPTFCKFVFGHSHVRINQQSFIRTKDVVTAAFPSLPLYTDYFYVPMHQLLSCWNDLRSQTNDSPTARQLLVPGYLPSFSSDTFQDMLFKSAYDACGYPFFSGAVRLADLLRYGYNWTQLGIDDELLTSTDNMPNYGSMLPFYALAYQKIYYDHYRNTAYEANDVEAYNIDDFVGRDGTVTNISNIDRLAKMFTLRYVNYRRDCFNTIYPSLNFVSSAITGFTPARTNLPTNLLGLIDSPGTFSGRDGIFVNNSSGSPDAWTQVKFTLDNVRAAFALEKLLRVSAFTPQHVKDQFRARFGYEPKSASMRESVRLKSFENKIIVGEVTATSQTGAEGAQRLGAIGGRGIGASSPEGALSYDVPEDGILMGISYVLPRMTYDSNAIDPINQLIQIEDWSLPEYENLGLQPLYKKNIFAASPNSYDSLAAELEDLNRIVGLQPRDMQFKTSVSHNHGNFNRDGVNLSSFVLHGKYDFMNDKVGSSDGTSSDYFKCHPNDLDDIFVEDYNGFEVTDQFFGNIKVHFGCIMDKPVFGIPNL